MATYSGFLAFSGLPDLATEGEVDFAAMTLRRAVHVTLRDEDGTALELGNDATREAIEEVRDILLEPVEEPSTRTTVSVTQAFTVSTTAVRLTTVNVARRALLIVNNGADSLYIADTSSVTASGSGMGVKVPTGGSYSDIGEGVYVGELWGIYGASASSENVVVVDRS